MSSEQWKRVEALFEAALERSPDERNGWLAEHCDDPQLRAEVGRLLAAHERPDGILDASLYPPVDEPTGPVPESRAERRIGSYRTVRLLGQGGMGSVYLAERADGQFDQQVALKLLRTGFASDDRVRRFRAERQILATLNHPNIARLLDGGVTEAGQPYFVMEHVDGRPLDRYCDVHQCSIRERLQLFFDVCEAVQYAHRNLVVHRDLKPSNILVTEEGQVKLLDFGIAKLLDPDVGADVPVTRTGWLPMTPSYASPEQVRGEPVTTASDVYQLGVVLYELLTGCRPYRLGGRTPSEIERIICEEEPARPSTAVTRERPVTAKDEGATAGHVSRVRKTDPARLQRKLRGDLDTIVLKALRKEPERRYDSAEPLADDLKRHLAGRPVAAHADTWTYRTRKFVRRHRWGVSTAAAFLVLLVGYALTVTWQAQRIQTALDQAQQETAKSEQVIGFMMDLFEASDPGAALGDTVTARELLARGVERAEQLATQPGVQAQMFGVIGRVYQRLGRYDEAELLLERALTVQRERVGGRRGDVAARLNQLAVIRFRRGDYEQADSLFRRALAMRRQVLGDVHPDVAETLNDFGNLQKERGEYAAAESLHREALAMRRQLFGDEHEMVAQSLNNLAIVLEEEGDYKAAEPLLREALDIYRALFGEKHPNVAMNLNNLGILLFRKGDYDEAESLYREALAIRRDVYEEAHPRIANTLNNLASLLVTIGNHEAAEPLLREALAMRRKQLGDRHPHVAIDLHNLASTLREQGDYGAAVTMYRDALDRFREAFGETHPHCANPLVGLARAYMAQGAPEEAEPLLREALAIRTQALPSGSPEIAETQTVLGACLTQLRRYEAAEPLLLEGYDVLQVRHGTQNAETQAALERLVALYEAWPKPDSAAKYRASLDASPPQAP